MSLPLEDYAMLGDSETAALVGKNGSIDWLAFPRFDSPACFAALLGTQENGHWQIAPASPIRRTTRRYRSGLVLETEWETDEGVVALIDGMPLRDELPDLVRIVEGRKGRVPMQLELTVRFDYGSVVPWVRTINGRWRAVGGPDALVLTTPVPLHGHDHRTTAEFHITEGTQVPFELQWHPSHLPPPEPVGASRALADTERWWAEWIRHCSLRQDWPSAEWRDATIQSLVVLKGLTYHPTGGIVAAATTSLPEKVGGHRNWDYRACWLRDATFTLLSLLEAGYTDEAREWRDWLLRAVAGDPSSLQIMYGPAGERRLDERELPWLSGYEGSQPVRIGNGAHGQFQLDVWGEVMDALWSARHAGLDVDPEAWRMQEALVEHLETSWHKPDDGIWEVRGGRRQFTHSKVMAWVAFDRAARSVESMGVEGPGRKWRALADEIHADVCANGVDDRGAFVQSYGAKALDASLLMVPLVGFLPPDDPRVRATVDAIATELTDDNGFVWRYRPTVELDGFGSEEGAFLMCSFWLADCLSLTGREAKATALFEKLLSLRNDVGLLAEQYDSQAGRMLGNFPQAFSHVGLIGTATNLTPATVGPAHRRRTPSTPS